MPENVPGGWKSRYQGGVQLSLAGGCGFSYHRKRATRGRELEKARPVGSCAALFLQWLYKEQGQSPSLRECLVFCLASEALPSEKLVAFIQQWF